MKKKLMKGLALMLSLTLVMGLFASCGGGKEGGNAEAKTDLTVAIDADYATLHPADTMSAAEARMTAQIYDPLIFRNYEDQTKLESRVAEKWEVSEDGKCYTFYLRDDITFHNGDPVTAEDVGFSLDLFKKSQYQGAVVDGLDHYDIVDAHTIKIYTTHVYAPFLTSMSDLYIASKKYYESVDENTFAQEPIGCGPYKFVSHDIGDKAVFEAYDGYYQGEAPIKKVTWKVISDVASMGMAIQTGEIDFAEIDASVKSTLEGVDSVKLLDVDQTTFGFVAMNTEKEPYNNVKFRQAINYAIDRESILASVAEGLGNVNSNILAPGRMGYSEEQIQYTYDVEKAKALLKEAGVKEGTDLGKMYVAEQYKLLAQMVQANLEAVGLKVKIEILEFNAYLDKLRQGDFGITALQMGLEGDTQMLSMALTKDYIGMANNARYSNKEIEDMFKEATTIIDDKDREALYVKLFTKVQEEAVYAILYNPGMLYAANANLNVHTLPLEGEYYFYDFSW
ncbi:ABC transporter substrate-binding protein [Anaerovoracaceae bacterium 41-7]